MRNICFLLKWFLQKFNLNRFRKIGCKREKREREGGRKGVNKISTPEQPPEKGGFREDRRGGLTSSSTPSSHNSTFTSNCKS